MHYKVISTDDHVSESKGTWVDRVPQRMKDKVPQVKEIDGVSTWTLEGKPMGGRLAPSKDAKEIEHRRATARFQDRPGNYNAVERLRDYDLDGIDGAALFPNMVGFTNPMGMIADKEVRGAALSAYNDWLVEEFCSTNPQRLFALSVTPGWDVEMAILEATRAVKKGHKGIVFDAVLDVSGNKPTWDKYWDPFYSAVEDLGVPLCFHQPSAAMDRAIFKDPKSEMPQYIKTTASINHVQSLIYPTVELMMSGVLERHPRMKVLLAEAGASWLMYTLNQCDYYWPRYSRFDGSELRMLPSDYFRRQVYTGFWSDTITPQLVEQLGEEHITWEGDYLHSIATFPGSQKIIKESLKHIPDESLKAKITGGNAVKLFNIK